MRDIDAVVHQKPGIYVCKMCVESPDLNNALLSLVPQDATLSPTLTRFTFRFSIAMYDMMNLENEELLALTAEPHDVDITNELRAIKCTQEAIY